MIFYGKSRDEIKKLTKKCSRLELVDLLWRHCSLEPKFSPRAIAKANELGERTVRDLMARGVIRSHLPARNRYRASLSAVRAWDSHTALTLHSRKQTND